VQQPLQQVRPALVADTEAAVAEQTGERALHHPSMPTQSLRGVASSPRNPRTNAACTERTAQRGRMLRLVGVELHWTPAGPSGSLALSSHRPAGRSGRTARRLWPQIATTGEMSHWRDAGLTAFLSPRCGLWGDVRGAALATSPRRGFCGRGRLCRVTCPVPALRPPSRAAAYGRLVRTRYLPAPAPPCRNRPPENPAHGALVVISGAERWPGNRRRATRIFPAVRSAPLP
jgi:hypothetical protein